MTTQKSTFTGLGAASAAYLIWGLSPIYWKSLAAVPAFEILNRFDVGILVGDQPELVASECAVFVAHHGHGMESTQIDAVNGGTGRKARHVETPGTHGLDLSCIGLGAIPFDTLAGLLGNVVYEFAENIFVNRRVFYRGV